MAKYRRAIEDVIEITSANRGITVLNYRVYTYEQTKKGLSYFYPKRVVLADGIHTEPVKM